MLEEKEQNYLVNKYVLSKKAQKFLIFGRYMNNQSVK